MGKTLSANVTTSSTAEEARPIDLFIVYLDSGTLYFAGHDTDIEFYDLSGGAQTYTATAIKRGEIHANIDLQVDTCSVSLDNVNRAMSAYVASTDLRGRRISILKVFLDYLTNSEDYVLVFDGVMDKPTLTESQLHVSCVSRLGTLNLRAPRRMYQVACNWEFASTECGYDRTGTGVSGQVAESGTTIIFYDDQRAEADDYFKHGEVQWVTAGLNSGLKRKIVVSSGTKFIMDYALPSGVGAGDTYNLWRGCPKTQLWCSGLSNLTDYGGFKTIPHEMVIRG